MKRVKIDDKELLDIIWVCLAAAIAFAVTSLILPPLGVIDSSVLILIGQFLVLIASVLLGSATVAKQLKSFNKLINKDK